MKTLDERLNNLIEKHNLETKDAMPVALGNKQNVKVGGEGYLGQRFPVTLYAPSWVWFLQTQNIESIISFLEDDNNNLKWEK